MSGVLFSCVDLRHDLTYIQWTDATWNIARGCTKVDEDCKFCYEQLLFMETISFNIMTKVSNEKQILNVSTSATCR
jgi:protein gp37